MAYEISETTTVTIHSLVDPACPLPESFPSGRLITEADLQELSALNLRPTPQAVELVRNADFIFVIDVMTRREYFLYGRGLTESRTAKFLRIESDLDGDELLWYWILCLTKAIKGAIGPQPKDSKAG